MRLWSQLLPALALTFLPLLKDEQVRFWPDVPIPSALGAQVEQETCPSLKSSRCWNPRTELKTDREYGFGLGQLTVTSRFNAFEEVKAYDASLRNWKWEDRYDPRLQLRSLVLKDRYNWDRLSKSHSGLERLAFSLAGYNGGLGGVLSDISYCRATPGCDPTRWWNNVELTSHKSKTKWKGYGKSAFEINREYVLNVLVVRRARYLESMEGNHARSS